MSSPAIRVENLGKRYRLGATHSQTLGALLSSAAGRLFGRRNGHAPAPKLPGHGSSQMDEEGNFWALKDVSFDVQPGEVVGIIGHNGAGKSTLLKILSNIVSPTTGHVELHGRAASLLEVGTGFHPELTGRENVFLNGAILGMTNSEVRRKFDEIVAFAEIDQFIDTPVKRYSSGMYVRLAFAVAAHLDPEILILDEVLAVGDIQFQKKCLSKIGDVAQDGRTILFVSHSMTSILALCSRAILLNDGQVSIDAASEDVIRQYIGTLDASLGEVTWDDPQTAPGNDKIRIRAVRIISDDKVTGDVDISKETTIQIDYWVLQEGLAVHVSIHILDEWDSPVLATSNMTSATSTPDPWFGRDYPQGLFRTSCRIPGNFLNSRRYRVNALVLTNLMSLEAHVEGLMGFTVHDSAEMRKEYLGHWIGTVRPKLPWHTEQIFLTTTLRTITSAGRIQ